MNRLLFAVISTLIFLEVSGEDLYTDRYDNINIEEILSNRRLLIPYVKCILEQGRCTPEGKELRLHIKEAMQHSCAKCTEKQKDGARRVVKYIRTHEADYWEDLKKKYDPDNTYKETYEKFLNADETLIRNK